MDNTVKGVLALHGRNTYQQIVHLSKLSRWNPRRLKAFYLPKLLVETLKQKVVNDVYNPVQSDCQGKDVIYLVLCHYREWFNLSLAGGGSCC